MPKHSFIDHVRLHLTSGHGGRGAVTMRREKYVAKGGPDGGDGGRGGHIKLRADAQLGTLLDLRYRKFIKAPNGEPGQKRCRTGKQGQDEVLRVPLGTIAYDAQTKEPLAELLQDGEEVVLLPGGKGGLGNWHFRSARRQRPDYAQSGLPGQEREVILELKMLAEVGLVGFPNAGKSTLLATLSAARPAIADYPFTTLVPNLGMVRYRDDGSYAMADIPGLIEGASEGKGLGHRFLRHIERNALLLLLISSEEEDPEAAARTLLAELEAYDPLLLKKPIYCALSKTDLLPPADVAKTVKKLEKALEQPVLPISAAAGTGLQPLQDALWQQVQAQRKEDAARLPLEAEEPLPSLPTEPPAAYQPEDA